MWGRYIPDMFKSEEYKNNIKMHPELKKMLYSTL